MAGRTPELTRRAARTRYVPPSSSSVLSTADLGFTNGALLQIPQLYAAGDLGLLQLPSVAIVGSRGASAEGQQRATQLARELVKAGIVVMSGLAAGIDGAAHRAAIGFGGRTIAVTAMPLDRAYPAEHAELQTTIHREHLLLTPFPVGKRIFPKDFPERNRVMARLARATVVIEAGDTSGTLHQVAESVHVGRPVFIAKSVVDDPRLTWPARFLGQPLVHVLESAADVLAAVKGS